MPLGREWKIGIAVFQGLLAPTSHLGRERETYLTGRPLVLQAGIRVIGWIIDMTGGEIESTVAIMDERREILIRTYRSTIPPASECEGEPAITPGTMMIGVKIDWITRDKSADDLSEDEAGAEAEARTPGHIIDEEDIRLSNSQKFDYIS